MRTFATILLATIFMVIALLHVYWVLGGKWGLNAAIPEVMKNNMMTDSKRLGFKVATLLVAIGLFMVAYLFLIYTELVSSPVPSIYISYSTCAIAGIFLLRAIGDFKYVGFFKSIKQGDFANKDSKYFSPLCLIIFILTMIVIF